MKALTTRLALALAVTLALGTTSAGAARPDYFRFCDLIKIPMICPASSPAS